VVSNFKKIRCASRFADNHPVRAAKEASHHLIDRASTPPLKRRGISLNFTLGNSPESGGVAARIQRFPECARRRGGLFEVAHRSMNLRLGFDYAINKERFAGIHKVADAALNRPPRPR
jgi:hypothetical protein